MFAFKKLSAKIFVGIFVGAIGVYTLSAVVEYYYTKNAVVSLTTNYVERAFRTGFLQIESELLPVLVNAENTFYFFTKLNPSAEFNDEVLSRTLTIFKDLKSAGVQFKFSDSSDYYRRVWLRKNDSLLLLGADRIDDYFNQRINLAIDTCGYRIAIHDDTITLIYSYVDKNYEAQLIYDADIDFFHDALNKEIGGLRTRYYLFNDKFKCIVNSNEVEGGRIRIKRNVEIQKIEQLLKEEKMGLTLPDEFLNKRAIYISQLSGTNLYLASTMRTDAIVHQLRRFYQISFLITFVAILLLAYILQIIILRITKPIRELSVLSKKIEKGSLHTIVPEYKSDGDTEQLSNTLRILQDRMQRYVSNLHDTLKQKREYDHEINVAEKIQLDMLPEEDRALIDLPSIDIYTRLKPAKGVAGDFYDYFFIDKQNLFFILGDVSGKGVPAALFMVKAVTLLQLEAQIGKSTGEIFESINTRLIDRNDEGMFVTAICGVINIFTGELELCDAGHNTPLFNVGTTDYRYLELNKNMPLGIMEGKSYKVTKFNLKKGEGLIIYSDGLPEATNVNGDMLGGDRVEKVLVGYGSKDIKIIANNIWSLYDTYTFNATPSDDVTLLIVRFMG